MKAIARRTIFGLGCILFALSAVRVGSMLVPWALVEQEWNVAVVSSLLTLVLTCLALLSARAATWRPGPH
jgi:hypothetical protein